MKKVIAIVLCFAVLAFVALPQRSDAALAEGLIVGGAAVMTAALAVDTLIVAAGGAGMMDAIRKTAQNNNMTVSQFMSNEYADYRNSNGENLNASLQRFVNGAYFNPAGQLILSFELGHYITRFLQQLWSQDGGNVIANGTLQGPAYWQSQDGAWKYAIVNFDTYVKIGNRNCYYNQDTYLIRSYTIDGTTYTDSVFPYVGKPGVYWVTYGLNNQAWYAIRNIGDTATSAGVIYSNKTSTNTTIVNAGYTAFVSYPYVYDSMTPVNIYQSNYIANNTMTFGSKNIDYGDGTQSDGGGYAENPNVYDLPQNQEDHSSVLDIPEVILPDSAADVGSGTINIGDYLQSLANALATDATVDLTVTLENEATVDIPLTVEQDIPVDTAAEDDVAVGDKEDVATETDASALEPYMVNLTDFFPFCIPFDIHKMLSMFAASAQAPRFEWRFYVPRVCDETIVIDLSAFDSVAQVLRTMEMIAFAVGLAFATKKLIQGGD